MTATNCPLCGQANRTTTGKTNPEQCTADASCWCMELKVPAALLARIPAHLARKACICKTCVDNYYRQQAMDLSTPAKD
jgi:hypothetical protein